MITRSKTNKMGDIIELKTLMERIKLELGGKIDALCKMVNEKDIKIVELEKRIVLLEEKLAYSDKRYVFLKRCVDDNEQYGLRTSLRINGIPSNANETSEECLTKVKDEARKIVGSQLDDRDFDRKSIDREGNPVTKRQIIVKFKS